MQWSAHELERVRGSRITPSPVLARGNIELPFPVAEVGFIRLRHSILPISGKPEITAWRIAAHR